MKTLRAAQHLDLALPSMTEVYPRYHRSSPDMQVYLYDDGPSSSKHKDF